ncbi:MAG: hypothetical protein U9Q66_03010, partial [Patescibacteria group bacterium]|nr:hypothetical protein [Patescibacteria group bacterium]
IILTERVFQVPGSQYKILHLGSLTQRCTNFDLYSKVLTNNFNSSSSLSSKIIESKSNLLISLVSISHCLLTLLLLFANNQAIQFLSVFGVNQAVPPSSSHSSSGLNHLK